jgi:hypothetical protein
VKAMAGFDPRVEGDWVSSLVVGQQKKARLAVVVQMGPHELVARLIRPDALTSNHTTRTLINEATPHGGRGLGTQERARAMQ